MSDGILSGVRVIEGSAFVAAPTAGMTLAQLGADVIRFDDPRGGLDYKRWPLDSDGRQPVLVGSEQGQALVHGRPALRRGPRDADAADHGARPGQRHLHDELPRPRLDELRGAEGAPRGPHHGRHDGQPRRLVGGRLHRQPVGRLPRGDGAARLRRADQQPHARVGHRDGRPRRHRPARRAAPSRRDRRGSAREIALSDVALATVGNIGRIAEVQLEGRDQPRDGNYLYGAFGGDFPTSDARRVMVVGLTAPPVEGAQGGDGHRGDVRRRSSRRPATTSAARPAATRAATSSASC